MRALVAVLVIDFGRWIVGGRPAAKLFCCRFFLTAIIGRFKSPYSLGEQLTVDIAF